MLLGWVEFGERGSGSWLRDVAALRLLVALTLSPDTQERVLGPGITSSCLVVPGDDDSSSSGKLARG